MALTQSSSSSSSSSLFSTSGPYGACKKFPALNRTLPRPRRWVPEESNPRQED
ncbi:uncharacterized protein PADG_11195 [Paracoccidioides brasiliensis Pb18]|uniref:Uncharacterized protein n=1 Tax=Paracoccidioides brasiliensis (strain Pb18) TaxID=502780 RepID=A0A0A0HW19_PARBD|nr:uncharacterized protein PADG_11195 [Paracoccidioides brasiliensis Pb18]KGM92737.1 hypothetical protein PADG_11195 [Paracoccidioides brasiliensis Pb18]